MKNYLLTAAIIIFITGCNKNMPPADDKNKVVIPDNSSNTLKPVLYKGMYDGTKNPGGFKECGSGKTFMISPHGKNEIIDSVYQDYSKNNSKKKIFISIEGFDSVRERPKRSGFDTVIVITRVIGTDTAHSCE